MLKIAIIIPIEYSKNILGETKVIIAAIKITR